MSIPRYYIGSVEEGCFGMRLGELPIGWTMLDFKGRLVRTTEGAGHIPHIVTRTTMHLPVSYETDLIQPLAAFARHDTAHAEIDAECEEDGSYVLVLDGDTVRLCDRDESGDPTDVVAEYEVEGDLAHDLLDVLCAIQREATRDPTLAELLAPFGEDDDGIPDILTERLDSNG